MKRTLVLLGISILSVFLLFGCGGVGDDTVVIIPSSHGKTVVTEAAAVSETEAMTEERSSSAEPSVTEAVISETVSSDDSDILLTAQAMMKDAAFLPYLEQYGVDLEHSDPVCLIAAVLAYQRAEAADNGTASAQVVYWTTGGSVWHMTRDCSALAKSKAVNSGSAADAAAQGKTRCCKRCGE